MNEKAIDRGKVISDTISALGKFALTAEVMTEIEKLVGITYDAGFADGATTAVVDNWDEEYLLEVFADEETE